MVFKDSTNTENYENEEIAKSYVVCMKLTVGLLLHLEKRGILERLNLLVMTKLKFCAWKGLVEHQIALSAHRMKT